MYVEQSQAYILTKYLNLFIRRNKWILVCVLMAVSIGLAAYLKSPKIYRSAASIIYQQQRINPSRFSPDEESQMREMVNTVSQQVTSRANLEKLIYEFNMYPELRAAFPIEDVMEKMRKNITIDVQRNRGNVFAVSFQGEDPHQVRRVTNALAAKFIEENLRVREERATETTNYIKDELRMAKEELNKKEALMRDYKLKYYNEMPDQRAANVARINALQEQFQAIQSNIHALEQTRLLVSEQIEIRERLQVTPDADATENSPGLDPLTVARRELQGLLSRYTQAHPSVIRIQKRIQQIESERIKAINKDNVGEDSDSGIVNFDPNDFRINELSMQLKEVDLNLKTLWDERDDIRGQIEKYQGWIDSAPVREAEWAALTRDYDELKEYHDALLAQSLAAEAAKSLEIRQKGSQFKVIDPAYLPNTPIKGGILKFFLMSVGVGLAVGFGLIVGVDSLDSSFKDPRDIEPALQVPVTCALPMISTKAENNRLLVKNIAAYTFFIMWLFMIGSAAVYFWKRGAIIL